LQSLSLTVTGLSPEPRDRSGTRIQRPSRFCTPRGVFGARTGLRLAVLAGLLTILALCVGAPAQAAITHPYTGVSFGPKGVASESFANVVGVAVQQSTGDVFVYDGSGGSVYKFDAAGEPVDFSSSGTNVIEGVGSSGNSEGEIAIDDSTGPDAGDIYVANNNAVKIYSSTGASLGELTGGEMCGVGVDPSGNVYVGIYPGTVRRYAPATNPVTNANETASMGGLSGVCNVAADSAGDVYAARYSGEVTKYDSLQFGSMTASGTVVDTSGRTLAVDPVSGEVFIDEVDRISQYDGATEPPELEGTMGGSGTGALTSSFGVAVNHTSGDVYAAVSGKVEVFGAATTVPGARTDAATEVSNSSATLNATIEPSGSEVTTCTFEYGTEAGVLNQSASCEPAPPYTGSTPVAVTAHLTGLNGNAVYHYRITQSNAIYSSTGAEVSFTTEGPPQITNESFSDVGSTTAVMGADIAPGGQSAHYEIEYGTSSAYGSSTAPVTIGAGEAAVPVQAHLAELQPGTTYHFRFVAVNATATATGPDLVFATHVLTTPGLPDDRGYELVTPAENEGAEPYSPDGATKEGESAISTSRPMVAAADGDAVAYAGSPTSGGNGSEGDGLGNEFLARRNASGVWTQEDIQPTGYNSPAYWGFSAELDAGVLMSHEAIAPGGTAGYHDLYVRDNEDDTYQPLSTVTPPNRTTEQFGAAALNEEVNEFSIGERYAGASADYTHQLFEANDVLASGAVNPGVGANNLYESFDGQLRTVNILPDGTPAPNASFGGPTGSTINGFESQSAFSHVISADGSRIFWTDMSSGSLYVREDGVRTSLIAESATYLTASSDGSKVLYTKTGDLYEDDLEAKVTRDLAPGGEVIGLMGAGENLEYVYFVAKAALATGASAGESNMYVLHGGETKFIATLGSEGEENTSSLAPHGAIPWDVDIGYRTADVTPSGSDITFMSVKSLTGYDNVSHIEGQNWANPEVYAFDAGSGQITCASCDPTGEPPIGYLGGILPISKHSTYQLHLISEDGDRVFFESPQMLLPQAQNGRLNVYEWERDGSGSCTQVNGCIYLLSSGSSPYPSYLIDASASGDDVFLMTRSQLVPADKNEYNDIYDAHVGTIEAPAAPQCTGTGCQGAAAMPPVFATPASVTFNGVGNLAPAPSPVAKPKPTKKPSSCAKKKAKKPKAKRSARQAKAKPVLCKAKKPAKRARRGTNGKGGR
jgi:hypothetical protein